MEAQGRREETSFEVKEHPRLRNVYIVSLAGEERLATKNLVPGVKAYNEKILSDGDIEYRIWSPYRSKLAASILKDMDVSIVSPKASILYLGASTGTTVSHISDIIGAGGVIFAVDNASRVMREFIGRVATPRLNVFPLLADARHPYTYGDLVGEVDAVYCDVAQPDQTLIAIENSRLFLRDRGTLLLAVKAKSIDVTKPNDKIFRREKTKLTDRGFEVLDLEELEPFEKDHAFILATMR